MPTSLPALRLTPARLDGSLVHAIPLRPIPTSEHHAEARNRSTGDAAAAGGRITRTKAGASLGDVSSAISALSQNPGTFRGLWKHKLRWRPSSCRKTDPSRHHRTSPKPHQLEWKDNLSWERASLHADLLAYFPSVNISA